MPRRVAEVARVFAMAAIVTAILAAPVLQAPSERLFGMEIVGRHHDPFTVMEQFARPVAVNIYTQPVTDIPGAWLARLFGVVMAYNALVLLSFPLSAAAAYLLARHLLLSTHGATVAAMAYAFSPFHLAHAAYHPHVAQTQWVPLYVLALWRCLDQASPAAVGFLAVATMAVTLSNFYAGFIMAIVTPSAVAAYWFVRRRADASGTKTLTVTLGCLSLLAATAVAYSLSSAAPVLVNRAALAFPRADLFAYSAKWWSYLTPPVAHPLLGATVRGFWTSVGVRDGLLEQQVTLGCGVIALGLVAIAGWWTRDRRSPALGLVPVLVVVAVTALLCSLSPERIVGPFRIIRPAALLYDVAPMFRSYARFGLVVQLMAALLAGIGVDRLLRTARRPARIVCAGLVALAAFEYALSPSALWRDVLPTTAHRWLMQQGEPARALDCSPLDPTSRSVQWLTRSRVTLLGGAFSDCQEPHLSEKLAAQGYTHLIVRGRAASTEPSAVPTARAGLEVAARFRDAQVMAITSRTPAIYLWTMTGFFPREQDAAWTWRWMGPDASWTIVNTTRLPIVATLAVELSAFHHPRRVSLWLDDRLVQTLVVDQPRRIHRVGPLLTTPGRHDLVFRPIEPPTVASDVLRTDDRRPLSLAVGTWDWIIQREHP